tara:strand:+ start:1944 stop:2207 length:264 start_codon:yes stop_codon:yes gene_type:complete
MEKQILKSLKQSLKTLKYLKELTFKYDETNEELTAKEWETIKTFQIDQRKWRRGYSEFTFEPIPKMTADEYWDNQIEYTKNMINKLK